MSEGSDVLFLVLNLSDTITTTRIPSEGLIGDLLESY